MKSWFIQASEERSDIGTLKNTEGVMWKETDLGQEPHKARFCNQ